MGTKNYFTSLLTCKVLKSAAEPPGKKRELPHFLNGEFQYNWIGCLIIGVPMVMSLLGAALQVPLTGSTFFMCIVWCIFTGVGVTTGYHRYFSHRSFTANTFFCKLMAICGAGAFEGSIKWWARLHRIHHKYVDTDKDPYDARRGFWFSHCGWFIMRMDYDLLGEADVSDLDNDPLVKYQRENFALLSIISGILLPWLSCILYSGDVWGGFFYGVFLKAFIVHQCSFCINSLAHTNWFWAKQHFSSQTTPHDSFICALLTFGEGYHNFHHTFANDYRNGHKWYHFDPTKWWLNCCAYLGMCKDLVRTPDSVIERSMLQLELRRAQLEGEAISKKLHELEPTVTGVLSETDVASLVASGRKLIVINDYVLDVEKPVFLHDNVTGHVRSEPVVWYDAHPGGRAFLDAFMGKDATEAINGGVYKHTVGAHHMLPELRIAHLKRNQ